MMLSVPLKIITAIIFKHIQPFLLVKSLSQQTSYSPCHPTGDCILALKFLAPTGSFPKLWMEPLLISKPLSILLTEMPSDSFLQGISVPSKYINILQDLYNRHH